MNVLIVDQPDQFILDLQIILIKSIGCQFVLKATPDDAVIELLNNPDYILIICKDNYYESLKEKISSFDYKVQIVCRSPKSKTNADLILDESSVESSTGMLSKIIRDAYSKKIMLPLKFIPIKAVIFLNIEESELVCDVYIKITRSRKPDQYVKRLHAKDKFSKTEIKSYINSGLIDFYIPEVNYVDFFNIITKEIIKSLKSESYKNLDRYILNSTAFDTAMERLKMFPNIDEITIELVDESLKSIAKSIEKSDSLTQFFNKLKNKNCSFSFLHTYFTALLAEKLSRFFEWNTPQARDKLMYLAFFHDFSLSNSELSQINSASELETSDLTKAEKEKVLNHANLSAEMLSHFREIPFDLSQLVKEHHGSKTGIGFPENLSISISPMAMMFVVIEDFASLFIKNNISSAEDLGFILKGLEDKYSKQTYVQTLNALKTILLPKAI